MKKSLIFLFFGLCLAIAAMPFGETLAFKGAAQTKPSAGGGGPVALPVPVIHDTAGAFTFYEIYSVIPVNGSLEMSLDGTTAWVSVGSGVITDGGVDVFDVGFGYNDNEQDVYYRLKVSKTGWLDSTSEVYQAYD